MPYIWWKNLAFSSEHVAPLLGILKQALLRGCIVGASVILQNLRPVCHRLHGCRKVLPNGKPAGRHADATTL